MSTSCDCLIMYGRQIKEGTDPIIFRPQILYYCYLNYNSKRRYPRQCYYTILQGEREKVLLEIIISINIITTLCWTPQLLFCQFPQSSNYTPNSSSCCGTERWEIYLKKLQNVGFLPWDPGTPSYDFSTFFTLPYAHTGPLHWSLWGMSDFSCRTQYS